jgi:hypothetical protein
MDGYRPTRVVRMLARLFAAFYVLGWIIAGVLLVAVLMGEAGGSGFTLSLPVTVDLRDSRLQSAWTGQAGAISLQEADATLRVPFTVAPASFRVAMYVTMVAALAIKMLFLYHLRELFRRVRDGAPFDPGNAARLRWLGGLIVAGHLLYIIAGGWLGRIVLSSLTDASIALRPSLWLDERLLFSFNEGLIVLAAVLFALAEIFNRGAELEDEQSLVV